MAASALEAIETSTATAVGAVTGVASVQAVPVHKLFERNVESYPGANVCLNEDEVEVEDGRQRYGSAFFIYRVPVYVAIYAISDGTTEAGARRKAWEIGEEITRTLIKFVPSGQPADVTMYPLAAGPFEPISIDANTHGLLMQFWAKYSISVS